MTGASDAIDSASSCAPSCPKPLAETETNSVCAATIAALGATLRLHLDDASRASIPFFAMLGTSLDELRARGELLRAALDGVDVRVVESDGYVGAGVLPMATLRSCALAWKPENESANAAARLRLGDCPVIGRVEGDRVVIDLRTIPPNCDAALARAIGAPYT